MRGAFPSTYMKGVGDLLSAPGVTLRRWDVDFGLPIEMSYVIPENE
jgi:hypothetical protein